MIAATLRTGEPAPDFELPDLAGVLHRLSDDRGRLTVINFWSADCPWSARVDRAMLENLTQWGDGVRYLPIASNVNEGLDLLVRVADERQVPLVLRDEDHTVADRYGAATTPHFFVVDGDGILRYQGAFDNASFRQREPTEVYLPTVVEALQSGRLPPLGETMPFGCTIVRFVGSEGGLEE